MQDLLTNENLRGMFKDSFELTHFAIEVGRGNIATGSFSLKGVLDWVRKHPTEKDLKEFLESSKEESQYE